jgi:hypothetical protein
MHIKKQTNQELIKQLKQAMPNSSASCPTQPITILKDRLVIETDDLDFKWVGDKNGYFLIKLDDDEISCGFVNAHHELCVEFRGTDMDKMIKEILKQDLLDSKEHLVYVAQELMLARQCLDEMTLYIQR